MEDESKEIVEVYDVPVPVNKHEQTLIEEFFKGGSKKYGRFILAALGSVPWIGGLFGAMAAISAENDQGKINDLQRLWVREHEDRIRELAADISDILRRIDSFGEDARKRVESPEYLALVRKAFRAWDRADTEDKRGKIRQLLTNSAVITLCPDDLVRLFIDWIDRYHEAHFTVIKEIFQQGPITRGDIWDRLHPDGRPRDDSPDAGLFSYLIRELSLGGVIHQEKEYNAVGAAVRARPSPHRGSSRSDTLESPFEDTKPYVLTALGEEFVQYVMVDAYAQLDSGSGGSEQS